VLFSQVVVDRAQLARHIRHALQDRSQITLRELCETRPLQHGLAELVAYLQLADDTFKAVIDEPKFVIGKELGRWLPPGESVPAARTCTASRMSLPLTTRAPTLV
jgi:hypothetical protein